MKETKSTVIGLPPFPKEQRKRCKSYEGSASVPRGILRLKENTKSVIQEENISWKEIRQEQVMGQTGEVVKVLFQIHGQMIR